MTTRYLYAVTDAPAAPLPRLAGLHDAPLHQIANETKTLAAVVSPLAARRVEASEANLWQHEAVLAALMEQRTVLPVRFGTALPNEAAAHTLLHRRHAMFAADLERVRGCVELSVRVLWEAPPAPPAPVAAASSGREYMQARLAAEQQTRTLRQQASEQAATLHAPLAAAARAATWKPLVTPHLLLTGAYLVPQAEVAAFRARLAQVAAAHPAMQMLCTGPWAPYHFVSPPDDHAPA